MTKIEEFFARYEEGSNSFDPELKRALAQVRDVKGVIRVARA
jgi:hypothetical protein